MQPIESVDYMIDYYAVIGAAKGASREEIASAIKARRVEWHPDTLTRAAPEVLKQAEWKNGLFARAEEILLDDKVRAAYDSRLTSFDQRLISADGHAIIDTARERICLDEMLRGEDQDHTLLHAHAKTMSGYDENLVKTLGQLYAANPSTELKALYRKQLESEWAYVCILENSAWAQAGVRNKKISALLKYADDYKSAVEAEVEKTAQIKLGESFADRLLAQGAGAPLLLMAGENAQGLELMTDEMQRARLAAIVDRFRSKTQGIIEITERKQALLETLVSLTDYEYLQRSEQPTQYCTLILTMPGFGKTHLDLRVSLRGNADSVLDPAYRAMPASALRGKQFLEDTILVDYNAEIHQPLAQILHIAGKHFEGKLK